MGYSDNLHLDRYLSPRQGSPELLWYHRTGWLTAMHNSYFRRYILSMVLQWYGFVSSFALGSTAVCVDLSKSERKSCAHKYNHVRASYSGWIEAWPPYDNFINVHSFSVLFLQGLRKQLYTTVERIPTSFVKEHLYRKFLLFISSHLKETSSTCSVRLLTTFELPHFTATDDLPKVAVALTRYLHSFSSLAVVMHFWVFSHPLTY